MNPVPTFPRLDSVAGRPLLATAEGRAAWHAAPHPQQVRLLFDHALHLLDLAVLDGRDRSIRAAVRFLTECQAQLDRVGEESGPQDRVHAVERQAILDLLNARPDVYQDFVRRCEEIEAKAA
jgi:hypothetical protein